MQTQARTHTHDTKKSLPVGSGTCIHTCMHKLVHACALTDCILLIFRSHMLETYFVRSIFFVHFDNVCVDIHGFQKRNRVVGAVCRHTQSKSHKIDTELNWTCL